MRNVEELKDRELMQEILKAQKQNSFSAWINTISNVLAAAVMIVILILVVPQALSTMKKVDEMVTKTSAIVEHADSSLNEIDKMVGNVNTLVEENTEDVDAALDKITAIDIESLNESIRKLNEAIEPLTGLFSVFGRK